MGVGDLLLNDLQPQADQQTHGVERVCFGGADIAHGLREIRAAGEELRIGEVQVRMGFVQRPTLIARRTAGRGDEVSREDFREVVGVVLADNTGLWRCSCTISRVMR